MITVLVLDDDFYVGQIHCRYVNEVPGFTALEPVRDLGSARAVLKQQNVDLLLVDYVLPEGTGVDLIRETTIDAVVLSAVAEPAAVKAALRAGALSYILKPFEASHLQGALRSYARFRRYWDRERVDQASLDRALRSLHDVNAPGRSPATVSGSATAATILETLEAAGGPMSAAEVAEAVGMSRATALRHLSKLAALRAVSLSLQYGSTGRPEHLYEAAASE